jgi:hypothetical protein
MILLSYSFCFEQNFCLERYLLSTNQAPSSCHINPAPQPLRQNTNTQAWGPSYLSARDRWFPAWVEGILGSPSGHICHGETLSPGFLLQCTCSGVTTIFLPLAAVMSHHTLGGFKQHRFKQK